jgi:hypothetical protein
MIGIEGGRGDHAGRRRCDFVKIQEPEISCYIRACRTSEEGVAS